MPAKIADRHIVALERHVKAGHFPTMDQTLDAALDQLDAAFDFDDDWVAPFLAQADADVAAGRVEDWDEVRKLMTAAAQGKSAA
jgi:hypothetical protein